MRRLIVGKYNKRDFNMKSALVDDDWEQVLKPLSIVGIGAHQYMVRPCRYARQYRLVLVQIAAEHIGKSVGEIYSFYTDKPGFILHPGPGRWAVDEKSAANGMMHPNKPKANHFLDVVLIQLMLGSKTKLKKKRDYIDNVVLCGQHGDAVHHYCTDVPPEAHVILYKDGKPDEGRKRIMGGDYLITYADASFGRYLTHVYFSGDADLDEVGRVVQDIFGLPKLGKLAKYLKLRRKKNRPVGQ